MKHTLQLKQRLRAGEHVTGTMVTIFDHPEIAQIIKNCGFDYFFVDAEHGYLNYDRLSALLGYARLCEIPVFMRLSCISKTEIGRALDMGADGVICPNVETAEQAREIVRLSKYAPLGERGVSMTRPHTGYQKVNTPEFMKQANESLFVVCQTESMIGVNNIDAILSVEGVDGVLLGPNDLSQQMGIIGQLNHPDYIRAVDTVIEACKRHGKFCGNSSKELSGLDPWIAKGMQFNQWSSDVALYMRAASAGLAAWRNRD